MYQELNAIVLPGGTMNMEWTDTGEQISKSSHLLQQEIYRRFTSDSETALLFLGFCDRTVPLSASLSFWREITGLFATKVRLTQDIETVRHRIKIAVERHELDRLLESVPLMTGSEYLSSELLGDFWCGFNAKC